MRAERQLQPAAIAMPWMAAITGLRPASMARMTVRSVGSRSSSAC